MIKDAPGILEQYAQDKREYLDTATKCQHSSLTFTPMVFESHGGGWSAEAQEVLSPLARAEHARGVWCPEGASNKIAERISMALQRAAARAVLRRFPGGTELSDLIHGIDPSGADIDGSGMSSEPEDEPSDGAMTD